MVARLGLVEEGEVTVDAMMGMQRGVQLKIAKEEKVRFSSMLAGREGRERVVVLVVGLEWCLVWGAGRADRERGVWPPDGGETAEQYYVCAKSSKANFVCGV